MGFVNSAGTSSPLEFRDFKNERLLDTKFRFHFKSSDLSPLPMPRTKTVFENRAAKTLVQVSSGSFEIDYSYSTRLCCGQRDHSFLRLGSSAI